MSTLEWQRSYPTLETVMEAGLQTLCTWCDNLPPPQTDVQRTVLRRLKARQHELFSQALREEAPEIAQKFNALIDRMERLGIRSPVRRV